MQPISAQQHRQLLAEIVDGPSTIEFHCIVREPAASLFRSGSGWLLLNAAKTLLGAVGSVEAADAASLLALHHGSCELLADVEAEKLLRNRFAFTRAIVCTRPAGWLPPAAKPTANPCTLRLLRPEDSLEHLPGELKREIEQQHRLPAPVVAGFVDGLPIGFAYCACLSAGFADISIDVLEGYRQRGYGRSVAADLIDRVIARGKTPVWGAVETNRASLALGASLGFTCRCDDLFVHKPGIESGI